MIFGGVSIANKSAKSNGGIYRVALHTAMGALATGTVEGAFATGAAASAAPQLNHLQAKLKQKLSEQGLESDTAEMISQSVLNLTLAGIGTSAGLDTGSTVYALNTDVNNRQLHPDEIRFILDEDRVRRFADKYGLSEEEAKKELLQVSLAFHDKEWASIYNWNNFPKDGNYESSQAERTRAFYYLWDENEKYGNFNLFSNFKPYGKDSAEYQNRNINKNEVFADEFSRDAYYKYASVPLDASQLNPVEIYQSYRRGEKQGVQNVLDEKYEFIKQLPNLTYEQIAESTIDTVKNAYNLVTDENYRNETVQNYIGEKKDEAINFINDINLDSLQGKYNVVAHNIGELKGEVKTNIAIEAVLAAGTGAGANVAKKAAEKIVKDAINGDKPDVADIQTTCINGIACFTAGTLIHTTDGLKPIETITHGDLIWSRQEFGTEYGYRPVIATKVTPNQEIYEVVVKHSNNTTETFKTTKEHPFWVEGIGWLKASLLEQGMTLLDKHGLPNVTIISQTKLTHTETVYNFEVQDFHTYHIGEYGVWVHNAECCKLLPEPTTAQEKRNSPGKAFSSTRLTELKVGESLFKGENFAPVPKQVADKLSGRSFNNFNEFRAAFWKEMANDPAVARNFSSSNLALMRKGNAPFVPHSQQVGGRQVYELDHNIEIRDGGAVYNLDNIIIRTPANHIDKTINR